jgi:hypothetical protein
MMPLFNLLGVSLIPDSLNPAISIARTTTSTAAFFSDLFPTLVKVIAAIAVLSIAYWGIQYMLSNVAGTKGVSKDRIWNSLIGLLLALSAFLILNIINPRIIESLNCFVSTSDCVPTSPTNPK